MDGFSNLFAAPPSYLSGLLGEDETERLRREAQQSGLMNLGLSLLAGAGPSPQRQGLGQLLAQGVMAGQQASRNAYEQAVRDRMMQEQIAEQRRVRAEQAETLRQQQVAQQMAQGLFVSPSAQLAQGLQRTGAEVTAAMPEASAMDVRMLRQPVPAAQTTGIDMDTLRNILINAPRAAAPYMQTVEQIQKLTPRPKLTEFDPLKELRDEEGRIVRPAGLQPEKPTTEVLTAMQVLGIRKPISELTAEDRAAIKAEISSNKADKTPKVSIDLKDPTAVARAQQGIVGDWRGVMKDVGALEIADRYQAAATAVAQGNDGNRAADGALIYAAGKIFDPSGAVQEGDKKTILGNRSIPDSIKGLAMRVFDGGDLLPKERQQLFDVLTEQVRSRAMTIERQKAPYVTLSKSLGGDGSMLQNPLTAVLEDKDLYKKYGLDRR